MPFRSKLEAWVWKQLLPLRNNKRKYKGYKLDYETEKLPYLSHYLPDFIITFPSGHKRYIESKGYFSRADQVKMNKVLEANPDLDIRMLFQSDHKVYGKYSPTRCSDWCNKRKVPFAINLVPVEWLHE